MQGSRPVTAEPMTKKANNTNMSRFTGTGKTRIGTANTRGNKSANSKWMSKDKNASHMSKSNY